MLRSFAEAAGQGAFAEEVRAQAEQRLGRDRDRAVEIDVGGLR